MELSRLCSKCKQEKPYQSFQIRKGNPSGQCRQCKTQYMKDFRKSQGIAERKFSVVDGDTKSCLCCNQVKPLTDFSPTSRGLGGVAAYCKPCIASKYRDKDKARIATAKYREKNKATYLESHKINQSARNSLKKLSSDGSVTASFMESLYSIENCYYCNKLTKPKNRTADHKISLSQGGTHSASNLVMACRSCNCSKRHKTPEEFFEYLGANNV